MAVNELPLIFRRLLIFLKACGQLKTCAYLELAVGRKLKSKTRTISNRGEIPRFIGEFPCSKSNGNKLPFDSLTALLVGIFLEWLKRVVTIEFEPHRWAVTIDGKTITVIPDYEIVTSTGAVEIFEAKYDWESLSTEKKERLLAISRWFASQGITYRVITREILERKGFIQTISKLRLYGQLTYSKPVLERALKQLASPIPKSLREYEALGCERNIPVSVVYHLAYHKLLRLRYERPRHEELELCRA